MADMKMVDDENKRDNRKIQAKLMDGYDHNNHPNRSQRRRVAKKRGVFARAGLWSKLNEGYTNKQTYRKKEDK